MTKLLEITVGSINDNNRYSCYLITTANSNHPKETLDDVIFSLFSIAPIQWFCHGLRINC